MFHKVITSSSNFEHSMLSLSWCMNKQPHYSVWGNEFLYCLNLRFVVYFTLIVVLGYVEWRLIILFIAKIFFLHIATAPSGPEPPHCRGFTITPRHTTMGRTSLDEWSARSKDLCLTARTHNTRKRELSIPWRDSNQQSQHRAAVDPRLRPRGYLPRLWMNEYRPVVEK